MADLEGLKVAKDYHIDTPFAFLMSNEKYPISLLFLRLSLCFFSLPVASAHRVYYANEPLQHSA